jgi:hypothetical protein
MLLSMPEDRNERQEPEVIPSHEPKPQTARQRGPRVGEKRSEKVWRE